jgi:hypothetical protein
VSSSKSSERSASWRSSGATNAPSASATAPATPCLPPSSSR